MVISLPWPNRVKAFKIDLRTQLKPECKLSIPPAVNGETDKPSFGPKNKEMRYKTEYKTVSFYSFVQLDSCKEQCE